jgi:hypothetical protein
VEIEEDIMRLGEPWRSSASSIEETMALFQVLA